ncbi:MAG: carboxypeptidase-like regulatory domain-containing protein [Acidobacteriota bacterium]|nr:carboxypeptidase-like regulatory domain-containing protein [Acidobacteriota bacterium]
MKQCLLVLSLFLSCILLTAPANAQAVGSISGHVVDASSAIIPGATVRAINQGTNAERTAQTDSRGYFAFPLLPIGSYTVRVEQAGFQPAEYKNAALEGQQIVQLEIKLQAAAVTATVNVQAEQSATTVQRADATLGQTIHAEQVADLPLNGRDFAQLALLTPGTTRGEQSNDFLNQGTSSEVSFRGSVSLSVQGMPENTNDWRIDGVDDNELTGGGVAFLPQVDAIQEFNVLTFNYSAQYGSRGGSTVLVSTKSGTNQFHGSAFEFLRNDYLDARNYFDPVKKGKYRQNEFGGSFGGPIFKDKTFFFVDYQGNRVRQAAPIQSIVPTDAQRTQHTFANPIFNPGPSLNSNPASAATRTSYYSAAAGAYVIPSSQISPIGQAILNLYPSALPAGSPGLSTGFNYTSSPTRSLNDDEFDVRIDHQLSMNDRIFARFSWDNASQFNPSGLPGFGAKSSFTSTTNFRTRSRNMALSETHIFSPHVLNQVAAGYNRDFNTIHGIGYGTTEASDLGILGANLGDPTTSGMTLISLTGFNPVGDRLFSPYQGGTAVFHYFDSLSVVKGNHSVAFGFDFRPMENNGLGETYFHGQMAFTKNFTAYSPTTTFAATITDPASGITGANGSPIASLLLGYPNGGNRQNQLNSGVIGRRWKEYRGYAQDNWAVSPSLTLNLGIAYGVTTPLSEAASRVANFDVTSGIFYVAGSQASTYAGTVASNKYANIATDYSNVEPRFGFSVSPLGPTRNTVLRGGYAIFHDTSHLGQSAGIHQNPPYTNTFTFSTNDINPVRVLSPGSPINGFPDNSQPRNPTTYTGSLVAQDMHFKQGIVQQYNLNFQQGTPHGGVLTVAYAGTHATRLFNNVGSFNGAAPGAGNNTSTRRPFTTLNTISDITSNGWLVYNSLQAKFEQRLRDLYFLASYTYSQAITNGFSEAVTTLSGSTYFPLTQGPTFYHGSPVVVSSPGNPAGVPISPYADRGASALQLRNNFTASIIYALPFGKGKMFLANDGRILDEVIGGWQVNSIVTSHSGFPLAFTQATNTSGSGIVNRPDMVAGCDLYAGAHTVNKWFNTSCFAAPTAQQLGNAPRTVGYGPQRTNVDFSLYKKFSTFETQNLEFRAEMFNLLNHSQFGLPDQGLGNNAFGAISTTVHENRQIQFALKYVF